jgi:hypothetical protein
MVWLLEGEQSRVDTGRQRSQVAVIIHDFGDPSMLAGASFWKSAKSQLADFFHLC